MTIAVERQYTRTDMTKILLPLIIHDGSAEALDMVDIDRARALPARWPKTHCA